MSLVFREESAGHSGGVALTLKSRLVTRPGWVFFPIQILKLQHHRNLYNAFDPRQGKALGHGRYRQMEGQ